MNNKRKVDNFSKLCKVNYNNIIYEIYDLKIFECVTIN